jgi:hypothetical protein
MLGAVKDDVEGEQAPLFRVLARRWKSFAPVQRERLTLLSTRSKDDAPKQTRGWISKPRQPIYSHQNIERKSLRTWNPWLWVK